VSAYNEPHPPTWQSTEQRWVAFDSRSHPIKPWPPLCNRTYYGTSQVFNSGGTPSAVLIDEAGRVASEVGVGTPDVLARVRSAPAVSA
jgi:hypothetical protein